MIIYSAYHKPFLRKTQEIITLILCFFKTLSRKNTEIVQHTLAAIGLPSRTAFSSMPDQPMMSLGPFILRNVFH